MKASRVAAVVLAAADVAAAEGDGEADCDEEADCDVAADPDGEGVVDDAELCEGGAEVVVEGEAELDLLGSELELVDGEALEELLGDGESLVDGEPSGEGVGVGVDVGDGEDVAEAGSAWHAVSVAAVVVAGVNWAAWALASTPRVRKPPLSKLTAAARTCAKRIRLACLRCSSGLPVCCS